MTQDGTAPNNGQIAPANIGMDPLPLTVEIPFDKPEFDTGRRIVSDFSMVGRHAAHNQDAPDSIFPAVLANFLESSNGG